MGVFKDQTDVIREFEIVHGSRYDYSKVKYESMKTKVTIICSIHGEFKQQPMIHKSGSNCPKCSSLKSGRMKYSKETIINQFKEVHGSKYDYSKVEYSGSHNKVEIICSVHGSFWQTPANHKSGSGCVECMPITHQDLLIVEKQLNYII